MNPLSGQVALVTGASRGIGRGIAVGLGEAGATVVVTGRTRGDDETAASGTLAETAAMVTARGGQGVAMQCDHRDDAAVADVFEAVERDCGRLDVLVNNVTALPDLGFLFSGTPFWKVPCSIWDDLFGTSNREAGYPATGIRDQLAHGTDPGRNYGRGFWSQQWLGLLRMIGR